MIIIPPKFYAELCKSEFVQQTKGQIISEGNLSRNQQNYFKDFGPSGSKPKNKGTLLNDI